MLSSTAAAALPAAPPQYPGIWRKRLGTPERITPVTQRHYPPAGEALSALPSVAASPMPLASIVGRASHRGFQVTIPLAANETIYGLGLQLHSVMQRGRKKTLRVNADPVADTGDSHAPVPFYVSNRGYGIFVDTARYLTIYCGNKVLKGTRRAQAAAETTTAPSTSPLPASYGRYRVGEPSTVILEVPYAAGVDIYVFGGPAMLDAVARYNLFSGGGPLPPRWGLGFWYRAFGDADSQEILDLAASFRQSEIPCDVLGFEPGWQTHTYSCSFKWSAKFPDPRRTVAQLAADGFHVNLWEHAFTHPTSPIYRELLPHSGNYEVWDGLVPDFAAAPAREIFGGYHERTFLADGIAGFKLDECDNSDYTRSWSFPELSAFPSGVDGEQMHCLLGLRYQDAVQSGFERRNQRTLGLVRSSHALAAPSPYVLYSDLYNHCEFIRGVVTAGFSGLLWCPEVRDAVDGEDLIRRLQTAVFSPLAMVNAWYIRNPPWKQVHREDNNAGRFAEGHEQLEAACKRLIDLRMQLVPYLYAAFLRYHRTGVPPFRALVLDYPDDERTWTLDAQYLAGDSLLVAPLVAGDKERDVYLPAGRWFDFWTGAATDGARTIHVQASLETIPVFVKEGTLLPLAEPAPHTADERSFRLTARGYGAGDLTATVHEDDGTLRGTVADVLLSWPANASEGTLKRAASPSGPRHTVTKWERIS